MKRILAALALTLAAATSFGATTYPLSLLSPTGSTSGQFVTSTGPSSAPAWTTVSLATLGGIVPVLNGGTGVTTAAAELSRIGAAPLASASPTGTWAFAVRPTFNGNTPYDTGNLTIANYLTTATAASTYAPLASPTGTGTATWPTLKASAAAHLCYKNTSAQSLNATPATITTWTSIFDANSNFNAATGIFTAPATGYYQISGQIAVVITSPTVGSQTQAIVVANSVAQYQALHVAGATTEAESVLPFSTVISLTAGQTALVQGYSSTTFPMSNVATLNLVCIAQLP